MRGEYVSISANIFYYGFFEVNKCRSAIDFTVNKTLLVSGIDKIGVCARTTGEEVLDVHRDIGTGTNMSLPESQLLAKMICQDCLQIMRGPVMACGRGHSVCSPCWDSRDNCSSCTDRFLENSNFLAENLIARIFFQSFKNLIRQYIQSRERSPAPTTEPSLETFSCRVCGDAVPLSALSSHFAAAHPSNVLKNGQSRRVRKREVNESAVYTFQLESDGAIYWFWRRNEAEAVRFGLQHVGGGEPARLKMFVFDVVSPDRGMNVRLKAIATRSTNGRQQHGMVATNVLGVGARFRVTVI